MVMDNLIIGFLIAQLVIFGALLFWLRRVYVTTTDGAINRLNREVSKANSKQTELGKKIREADEELSQRQKEAKTLTDKMRSDAQEQTKSEREKIISEARKEGEEIITKAQNAKVKIREELEKEIDIKVIQIGMKIVNDVLSEKAKGSLHNTLIEEFIERLQETNMDRIGRDVSEVDVITLQPIDDSVKQRFAGIIKEKLGREVKINASTDESLGGGVVLKFGSMALDGSVKNLIRESATNLQQEVETRYT